MSNLPNSTLERGLFILDYCSHHHEGVSFKELKALCGDIASTTLSRILEPLVESKRLDKDSKTGYYILGSHSLEMARAALAQKSLEECLQPISDTLAEQTGCSSAYFHWNDDSMYVRVKSDLSDNFNYAKVGFSEHPLTHTFYVSIQSALKIKELNSIGVRASFYPILKRVKEQGIYCQIEENNFKMLRITAPVFYGVNGKIAGSIGITNLNFDLSKKQIEVFSQHVKNAADQATLLIESLG